MKFLPALIGAAWLVAAAAQAAEPPAAVSPAVAAQAADPTQLVQSIAQSTLKALDADRDSYRNNPAKLRQLVDTYLLPYFDIDYAARLVLGRHWRDATPEQRKRFIAAFENSMLANYGNAIVEFTGDRMKILPSRTAPGADRASVRTEIRRSDGSPVDVNYSLHRTPQGWKAWDVVIEGISYVKSFRDDFGAEIEQKGLDAVIERLEKGGGPHPGAAANAKAGSHK